MDGRMVVSLVIVGGYGFSHTPADWYGSLIIPPHWLPQAKEKKKSHLPLTLFHDSFFVFQQIPYNILRIFQNRTA